MGWKCQTFRGSEQKHILNQFGRNGVTTLSSLVRRSRLSNFDQLLTVTEKEIALIFW
jgi:hypothetical protein